MNIEELREQRQALCKGMDNLSREEKERCLSFANAINSIEGVTISTATASDIEKWINGEKSFLKIFEDALERYGFSL